VTRRSPKRTYKGVDARVYGSNALEVAERELALLRQKLADAEAALNVYEK
jgi:hypothetical protein